MANLVPGVLELKEGEDIMAITYHLYNFIEYYDNTDY
jgi:hypothetical protein